ncbi:MAG: chorismate-binding protein, partial [Pseudomonadota bacterium]
MSDGDDRCHVAPDETTFRAAYNAGRAQVVWTRRVADLDTPVSAYLKLTAPGGRALSFILESVEGGATRGRYSIIGLEPDLVWRASGNRAEINRLAASDPTAFTNDDGDTLTALRRLLANSHIDATEGLPPMVAGVFGHMGYDTVRLVEHLPDVPPDDLGVPDAFLMRPTLMAIFDTVKDEITIVTPVRPTSDLDADAAWSAASQRLENAIKRLDAPVPTDPDMSSDVAAPTFDEPVSNTPPQRYLEMVHRAKDYITAGDAFQIVLSQRFTTPFSLPPVSLYRALRRTNPSPFLFYLDF